MEKITRFKDIPQFTSDGSYQVNYSLTSLVKYIEEEVETMELQLNPEFQRGHVWTEEQQIAWLEYHLRGGKSGNVIYLNNPFQHSVREPKSGEYKDYVCVDGLQRITAAQRFVHNEIKVFGSYFKEFEDRIRVLQQTMILNVNDLKTEKEVLQWYIDMNIGGTPHTSDEIQRVKDMISKIDLSPDARFVLGMSGINDNHDIMEVCVDRYFDRPTVKTGETHILITEELFNEITNWCKSNKDYIILEQQSNYLKFVLRENGVGDKIKVGDKIEFRQEGMNTLLHGTVVMTNSMSVMVKCKNGFIRYPNKDDIIRICHR